MPTIDASNWRESLRDHAHTMRAHFRDNPILCDLVLIRSQFGGSAVRGALQKIEQPIAALIEAGLDAHQAIAVYGAISVHTRGSAVLERIQDKTEGFPAQRSNGKRYIGFADDIDYDYILESILDHAQTLIDGAHVAQRRLRTQITSAGESGIRWSWSPGTAQSPRSRTAAPRRCSCNRRTGRRRRRTSRR